MAWVEWMETLESINSDLAAMRESQRKWAEELWLVVTETWFYRDSKCSDKVVVILRRDSQWIIQHDLKPQVLTLSDNPPAPDAAAIGHNYMAWVY